METEGGQQISPEVVDPTLIKPVSKFVALNPIDIVSDLTHAKTNTKSVEKIPLLASGIEGLDLLLESNLWQIEGTVVNKANTIRTLPHACGDEQEMISAIQPAAWKKDLPGGLYDPVNDHLSKNCVGHWQGRASSLNQFLKQSITTPCFMAFHIITIIGVVLAFIIAFTNDKISNDLSYKNQTLAIIISIAVGYDLLSCIIIIILEAFFPDDPDPFEASKVQEKVEEYVKEQLSMVYHSVGESDLEAIKAGGAKTETECVGGFVLGFFYEPAISALKDVLKLGGAFHKSKASTFTWDKLEDLLSVFRFAREISDSEVTRGVDGFEALEDLVRRSMVATVTAALVKGSDEVASQAGRMLALSLSPAEARRRLIEGDHSNLSLTHVFGGMGVQEIVSEVRRETKNATAVRQAFLRSILDISSGEELVSHHSHNPSSAHSKEFV